MQEANISRNNLKNRFFDVVGLGQNFESSLAPQFRTMSLVPDCKICAASLSNSRFFRLFRYKQLKLSKLNNFIDQKDFFVIYVN